MGRGEPGPFIGGSDVISTKQVLFAQGEAFTATIRQNHLSADHGLLDALNHQVTTKRKQTMTASRSDRNDERRKTIRAVAYEAMEAFWQVVVQHFLGAVSGDLSPCATIALRLAAEEALAEWIENNVPETTKVGD
jgi:hypothetical protein